MYSRHYWLDQLEAAWKQRSILWLSGVRRSGKTSLARALPRVEYLDCERPSTRQRLASPESFLEDHRGKRIVLDEIHRLPEPSEFLKVAADHFPDTRILATGSSTLSASARFRDTLTGRKKDLWLTPMLEPDLEDFGSTDRDRRLLHGGLPPFFLEQPPDDSAYQEWLDAFWAKDIQELFRLERRQAFGRLLELLLARSGGIFEASTYARPLEISRQTVSNYVAVLEATHVVHLIRPFTSHRPTEVVSAPKAYGFDTGFVACFRGIGTLRAEDRGLLWEHLVLNEIMGRLQTRDLRYWRDKRGHEVDFVLAPRGRPPIAIECKWSLADVDPAGFQAFRRAYADGPSYVVAADVKARHSRRFGSLEVQVVGLEQLIAELLAATRRALRRPTG